MLRARTSFGLGVLSQLSILIGVIGILLLSLAGTSQRFAKAVGSIGSQLTGNQVGVRPPGLGGGLASHSVEGDGLAGIAQEASSLWTLCFVISLIAVVLLCPLAVAVVRRFSVRLECITSKMLRISRNDTDFQIPFIHDKDELGDMARAVHVFKANALSLLESQELIEQLNVRFDAALNNMGRGLSMFDADEKLVVCNEQFLNMYDLRAELCQPGVSLRELIEMRVTGQGLSEEERARQVDDWYARHSAIMKGRKRADLAFRSFGGRTVSITFEPMRDGGCVAVHEDITEKRQREDKINRLARHDSLTGIANRFHFREQLDRQFAQCSGGDGFAVHLIDLDRFKDVNDTLGHAAGDVLLRLAAARIKKSMRGCDFVGRLGGDEFAIIQAGVCKSVDALSAAERLISILSAPFQIQGQSVLVGASIGIVTVPGDVVSPDDAIKKADIALYSAKDEGRGGAVLFRPELETVLRTRHQLGVDLRHAIRDGQFELFYQPIVALSGSHVACCEALMRWRHPLRGWVPPDEFIPVAEDLGLIGFLGEWALRKACVDATSWPGDIKVAVNLSPSQFETCDLAAVTRSALETAGLSPSRLELEVTESLLLRDNPDTCATLHKLRAFGVNIALDDFGTGYASLSYLVAFPFDKIKIDRMFVRDMVEKEQSAAIVCAISKLAQSLGIRSVAEGVETVEQLHEVTRLGCDEVQGYLFSRPVPAAEIGDLLSQRIVCDVAAA